MVTFIIAMAIFVTLLVFTIRSSKKFKVSYYVSFNNSDFIDVRFFKIKYEETCDGIEGSLNDYLVIDQIKDLPNFKTSNTTQLKIVKTFKNKTSTKILFI